MLKNKRFIALCTVLLHLCIGAVYAYSVWKGVLTKPLVDGGTFGRSKTDVTWIFSLAICFLGLAAAFGGRFVAQFGARKMGTLAAICYGLGTIGAGFAVQAGSLRGMYLTYGVLGGIGLGIGYVAPMSTLYTWFPDRKGFAGGLVIMGFGFASLIFGPIMERLITTVGLAEMFWILGTVFGVVMLIVAQFIVPATTQTPAASTTSLSIVTTTSTNALGSARFWLLRGFFFLNIFGGITLISDAKPMAEALIPMAWIAPALMVGIMGAFNGGGRFGRAALSDKIGRLNVFLIFFVLEAILFLILPHTSGVPLLFQCIIFVIMTCYGGGFACMPALVTELFGSENLSKVRGYVLTAWSAGGILGPIVYAELKTMTDNNYVVVLSMYAGLFAIAFVLAFVLKNLSKKAVAVG